MVRYDPYTDSFIDDLIYDTTATINLDTLPKNIVQMNVVKVSDESIEKIADAVVRKLTDYKTEPKNGYCNECKWYGDKQVCGRCRSRNLYAPMDEPQTEAEIVKAIVHKIIDDAIIAEDAYPDLRQKMHDAVDEYEPQTERSE